MYKIYSPHEVERNIYPKTREHKLWEVYKGSNTSWIADEKFIASFKHRADAVKFCLASKELFKVVE
jgi:hypothetical protein